MEQEFIVVYFKNIEDKPDIEEILCEKISDNTYRLLEIPLWADSLAIGDTINVVESEVYNGRLIFDDFNEFSDNSTLQIIELEQGGIKQILPTLEKFVGKKNIRFDTLPSYIAVNIPYEVNYLPLRDYLLEINDKTISFREACLAPQHRPKE